MEGWFSLVLDCPSDTLRHLPVDAVKTQLQSELCRNTPTFPVSTLVVHVLHPFKWSIMSTNPFPAFCNASTVRLCEVRFWGPVPTFDEPGKRDNMMLVPVEHRSRSMHESTVTCEANMVDTKPFY